MKMGTVPEKPIYISVLSKSIIFFSTVGQAALFILFAVTIIDVFLRITVRVAVPDSYDICAFMLVVAVTFNLGLSQKEKRHVQMTELVFDKCSSKFQSIFMIATYLMCCCLFAAIIVQNLLQSAYLIKMGAYSTMLEIPVFPFRLCIALGLLLFFLELLLVDIPNLWKTKFMKKV
ncbi:MAG: Tripartite ATP-independent periplasmic transporter [Syntrophorhabdus sp. PtaU1.Bin050]|nr:MAG: Tripartite ATP-independent periplasmic transporter [Syntrophorhabdus sp. PtaU1.Bin050]